MCAEDLAKYLAHRKGLINTKDDHENDDELPLLSTH